MTIEPSNQPEAARADQDGSRRLRRPHLVPAAIRKLWPTTLQGRLTLGFAGVVALSLLLVTVFVLYRLDDEFRTQQLADLEARTVLVAAYVDFYAADVAKGAPVVLAGNVMNPAVASAIVTTKRTSFIA